MPIACSHLKVVVLRRNAVPLPYEHVTLIFKQISNSCNWQSMLQQNILSSSLEESSERVKERIYHFRNVKVGYIVNPANQVTNSVNGGGGAIKIQL